VRSPKVPVERSPGMARTGPPAGDAQKPAEATCVWLGVTGAGVRGPSRLPICTRPASGVWLGVAADALLKEDAAAAGCRRGVPVSAVLTVPNPAGFTGLGGRKVGEGPSGSIAMDGRGGSRVGIGAGGVGIEGRMEGWGAGRSGIRAGARSLTTGFW
jgi:hypothetical protein